MKPVRELARGDDRMGPPLGDLLDALLRIDPATRVSAKEALEMPYLKEGSPGEIAAAADAVAAPALPPAGS
jgi:hypothetical protein